MAAPRIIDHQAHWYPPAFFEHVLGREHGPSSRRDGDDWIFLDGLGAEAPCGPTYHSLEVHLADMDDNGIDVSVLSPNLLAEVSRFEVDVAVDVLGLANAETARVQREHPDRLVGLAMLPMQDPDAAIEMLDRAIGEQDLRGVCVLSNIAGRTIVDDGSTRVYRRIEELDVPLFLHPSHACVVGDLGYDGPTVPGLGWMFETGAAALSLVYGGVLDACPDLVVVHPHLGGALPAVVDRVSQCEWGVDVQHDLRTYLRRNFYVDTVQRTPGAARLAVDTYGVDPVGVATDYPWVERAELREYLESAFDPDDAERILANRVPNLRLPAG